MDVLRHQAVAQQRHAMLPALLPQSLDVESPIFVHQEDVLTIVAALCDVVRNADRHHPAGRGIELNYVASSFLFYPLPEFTIVMGSVPPRPRGRCELQTFPSFLVV